MRGGDSQRLGELSVPHQMAIFSMYWNKKTRPYGFNHLSEFPRIGMSRNMHIGHFFIKDFRSSSIKIVNQTRDGFFISRNKFRRQNDPISFFNFNLLMLSLRHAPQRRMFLSLRSRTNHNQLFGTIVIDFLSIDQNSSSFGVNKTLVDRNGDIGFNAASHENHASLEA